MKLNLGCYDKKLPGYVNVDIREDVEPDVIDDAFRLTSFESNSVDEIYCSHALEHIPYDQAVNAIIRWHQVLKPDGLLRLAVPDFEAVCKRYIYTGDLSELQRIIYGSNMHEYDRHYCAWDFTTLSQVMWDTGFYSIDTWDWWEEDPFRYIDDFSHAYLPSDSPDIAMSHGRILKGRGLLMSLNIKGYKDAH